MDGHVFMPDWQLPAGFAKENRSYLKNVFWLPAFFGGIGAPFQIPIRLRRTCGLKLGPAAPVPAKPRFSRGEEGILNQNPIFEMGSNKR